MIIILEYNIYKPVLLTTLNMDCHVEGFVYPLNDTAPVLIQQMSAGLI